MNSTIAMTVVVSVGITALVTFLACKVMFMRRVSDASDHSDDFVNLRVRSEFARGVEHGRSEELAKFSISCQPFTEIHEEWMGMKKRVRMGYDMELTYSGLPLGPATRRVTHSNIEYNQETIERLVNSEVASAISSVLQLAVTKGISAKSIPRKV